MQHKILRNIGELKLQGVFTTSGPRRWLRWRWRVKGRDKQTRFVEEESNLDHTSSVIGDTVRDQVVLRGKERARKGISRTRAPTMRLVEQVKTQSVVIGPSVLSTTPAHGSEEGKCFVAELVKSAVPHLPDL